MDRITCQDAPSLTELSCPRCGGPFARIDVSRVLGFRCSTGHSFALETLAASSPRPLLQVLGDVSLKWTRDLRGLESLAAKSRTDGFLEMAGILLGQAGILESRLYALWDELGALECDVLEQQARTGGMASAGTRIFG